MKVVIDRAERIWKIPQPVLGSMRFTQKRLAARRVDLIDLESILPEIPPSLEEHLVHHSSPGMKPDKVLAGTLAEKIISRHLSLRNCSLDPEKEIVITPGIRATAMLLCLGLLNPGDLAAYPDPGLQYFRTSICTADGSPRKYSIIESNDYIINIPSLLTAPHKKMKLIFVNYPHNPTGSTVNYYFYRELLRALRSGNILVAADCAHVHPGNPDPSGPLQVKNASGKAIELHSFSTTFGIPGLGFAVGHKDVISILKMLLSAGGFTPSSNTTASLTAALEHQEEAFQERMEILKRRRELLSEGLKKLGWRVRSVRMVPFIWAKPQVGGTSAAFARRLYAKAGIRVAPGTDFGEGAEGWLRLSLTVEEKILVEALKRLNEHSRIWQRKYRPGN